MNPVRILVDSTADIAPAAAKRISIVPMTIHFGEEEFIDGVTIDRAAFYEKLVTEDVLPTTSQATPFIFEEHFRQAVDRGEDVVAITLSSLLSGTYQSAVIAAEEFPGRVHVVDSKSVAIGSAILAEHALSLVDEGLSAGEIAERLSAEREHIHIIALLDTLEYLKRGGRISKTVAVAGGLLSIKPAICLDGGEVKLAGTARGFKQGTQLLHQKITAYGGMDLSRPFLLGCTGQGEELLEKFAAESSTLWDGRPAASQLISGVVGTHVGPGAIAVAFFSPCR